MTDLEPYPDYLDQLELRVAEDPETLLPWTGELVDLRNPADVADALEQLREEKARLDQLRALLEDVLRLEGRRQGTKTLHLGHCDAVISGGSRTDYDIPELNRLLEDAGLPMERLGKLIVTTVTYKVNAAVAKQLAAANMTYAIALEQTKTVTPAPWRVTIKQP